MKKTIFKKISFIILLLFTSISLISCKKGKIELYTDPILTKYEGESTYKGLTLPKIGDEISGFKVLGLYEFKSKDAVLVDIEHIKTGARVQYIANDDINKTTCLSFNTLVNDDKGIPHVFEHSTLGGSKNYDSSNLIQELSNKTYNTYLNAVTTQNATMYPLSSLDDTQLFSLYKVYLDGVFNPNIMTDEKIFEREGYRYELNDENEDINLTGVVYSEMQGRTQSKSYQAYYNTLKTLFPGSFYSSMTGGKVSDIPNITYKEIKDFHDKFYHPSNMIITLYGNLDYKKYLEYTNDEYLKNYKKITIDKEDKGFIKNEAFVSKNYDFPVASGSDITNQSLYIYAVYLEGMDDYEQGLFSLVLNALNSENGPIRKRLDEKLAHANFSVDTELATEKPNLTINVSNVNEEDGDIIKNIVEESFKELVEKGIDKDDLITIINNIEIKEELFKEVHGFAEDAIETAIRNFKTDKNDTLGYFRYKKALSDIEEKYNDGTIKKLIDKYLSTNENAVLVGTIPRPGLLEKNDEDYKDKLKKYKDNLSDEEKNKLIENTKAYNNWVIENQNDSIIDKVRNISVNDLSEDIKGYDAKSENLASGIRLISAIDEDIKYNDISLLFDISNVSYEDIHKLSLLSNMLFYMPTENYDEYALDKELSKYAYNYNSLVYVNEYWNGGYKPYYRFDITSLNDNTDDAFKLIDEVMFKTKFDDVNKFRNIINRTYSNLYENYAVDPSKLTSKINMLKLNKDSYYDMYANGIEFMNYLNGLTKRSDTELMSLLNRIKELYEMILDKSGLVCEVAGNTESYNYIKNYLAYLSGKIQNNEIRKVNVDSSIKKYEDNTAIEFNTMVNYNFIADTFKDYDIKFSGKNYVVDNVLNDKVLFPEFRIKRSSYGAYANSNRYGVYFYTYRDPYLKETYDVYKDISAMLDNTDITNEELEDYKLSAYASFATPFTKRAGLNNAIDEILKECDFKFKDRYMSYLRDVKNTTLDDIKTLMKKYSEVLISGKITSGTSEAGFLGSEELFNEVVRDLVR